MKSPVSPKIVATVLAHDPGPSLERVLEGLRSQTSPLHRILVLDNGSRDPATIMDATIRHDVTRIRSEENLGVGGGHERLFRVALEDPEITHVLALEHDTYATPDCVATMIAALGELAARGGPPFVLSAHLERNEDEAAANAGGRAGPIRALPRFTFNGVLFPRAVIAKVGFPRADFFVGHEDWEYAGRVRKAGFGIYEATRALILHPTKGNQRFNVRPSVLRSYYSTRNWMRVRVEEHPIRGALGACAFCVASLGAILLRDDLKVPRSIARLAATRDALLNRMGPRKYWFLEARSPRGE